MQPSTQVVRRRADALQYRQMDDTLQNAIERADLPELVAHFYPDSGAQPGRKGVVCAVWRGDEHESFSLFRAAGGRWLYHDHRTRETGNAFGFLVDICGLSKAEAAAQLKAGGAGEMVRSPSGSRRGKARVQAGDAVFDALRRAVYERRVTPFVYVVVNADKVNTLVSSVAQAGAQVKVLDNFVEGMLLVDYDVLIAGGLISSSNRETLRVETKAFGTTITDQLRALWQAAEPYGG